MGENERRGVRFLCRIRLHKWGYWVTTTDWLDGALSTIYDEIRYCLRCGKCVGQGYGIQQHIEERLRKNAEAWNEYQKKAKKK